MVCLIYCSCLDAELSLLLSSIDLLQKKLNQCNLPCKFDEAKPCIVLFLCVFLFIFFEIMFCLFKSFLCLVCSLQKYCWPSGGDGHETQWCAGARSPLKTVPYCDPPAPWTSQAAPGRPPPRIKWPSPKGGRGGGPDPYRGALVLNRSSACPAAFTVVT